MGDGEGGGGEAIRRPEMSDAARKRVAVEMLAKHEGSLRRTARRYSICAADADDAFQRAMEILLLKAPPGEARELVRWMQTVTKHEALAIRRTRERQLGAPPPTGADDEPADWLGLIPSQGAGPAERFERREAIARSREALKTLKPAELKALTLLAEGYSYAEIGEMTGFSHTKVNRCLAEGRERFRAFLTRSETGGHCAELRPVLSAFCDGEATAAQADELREHLRVCAHCRAAMRAYRAAPRAVAVLAPVPIAARSLLERAHDAYGALQARLPGSGGPLGEASASQVAAAGGARGLGATALAKALAICAGTVGGAAVCVSGVVPTPLALNPPDSVRPHLEPVSADRATQPPPEATATPVAQPETQPKPEPAPEPPPEKVETEPAPELSAETEAPAPPAPESAPPPEPPPSEAGSPSAAGAGSPAGEFGP